MSDEKKKTEPAKAETPAPAPLSDEKKKTEPAKTEAPAPRSPLVKTVSEVEQMTDAERELFKRRGGTTISDPVE